MGKLQRSERIAVLLNMMSSSPGRTFNLGEFTEVFGSAKSSISDDIDILRNLTERFELGKIETTPGASGGVKFVPFVSDKKAVRILEELASELSNRDRILPGGFIYMLDIIYNPQKVYNIGSLFASHFYKYNIDYVITVETKGIPLAFSTASQMGVPLVIARHYSEAADGASVNINYVSGSSNKIQTMVLSLKALKRNSRLLFIDDFMKGGGTAKGILELAKQFECELAGIGVLISTLEPRKKLVEDYYSLMTLNGINQEKGIIDIQIADGVKNT